MSDKRKISTDALETLGTIITDGGRDAIHLAVEPVIAGELLCPGQDIGVKNGKAYHNKDKYYAHCDKYVGIVDPFLKQDILPGQKFWLVVYPRQITSLRHVWSHPDFEEKREEIEVESELSEKEISQNWINSFADRISQHPNSLMRAARDWELSGDYTYDNSESYKDASSEDWNEFWKHYEVVEGRIVNPQDKGSFFTCSC